MESKNNSPRNEKQEELIRRLEQIRKQRDTIQSSENKADEKQNTQRNRNQQETRRQQANRQNSPKRNQNRNMQKNQQPSSTYNTPSSSKDLKRETNDYFNSNTIAQSEIQDKIPKKSLAQKNKKTNMNQVKPLIEQLSSGENLTQAIIINEILSKPIALRYKDR